MFDKNFFPSSTEQLENWLASEVIYGKTILEPEAGKGDIVDYLLSHGASSVLACENHPELRKR